MRKRINFTLNLIPLASGGWNFDLQAVGSGITSGYHSPLASYISPERAIRRAREHAARLALSACGTIGNLRITRGQSVSSVSSVSSTSSTSSTGGSHALQN